MSSTPPLSARAARAAKRDARSLLFPPPPIAIKKELHTLDRSKKNRLKAEADVKVEEHEAEETSAEVKQEEEEEDDGLARRRMGVVLVAWLKVEKKEERERDVEGFQ